MIPFYVEVSTLHGVIRTVQFFGKYDSFTVKVLVDGGVVATGGPWKSIFDTVVDDFIAMTDRKEDPLTKFRGNVKQLLVTREGDDFVILAIWDDDLIDTGLRYSTRQEAEGAINAGIFH